MGLFDFRDAIASIESRGSGDYAAVGPLTKKGNRAYGRYQVMDFNIGPWTQKHFGKRLSTDEFLSNHTAQDAVFDGEFGSYLKQHGNPQDAASMWFTGRPLSQGAGAKDILGTSGQSYVDKFNRALGNGGSTMNFESTGAEPQMAHADHGMDQRKVLGMRPEFWTAVSGAFQNLSNPGSGDARLRAAHNAHLLAMNDARKTKGRNRTVDWMRTNDLGQFADMVDNGVMSAREAIQMALQRPDQGTAAMQNYQFLVSQGLDPKDAMEQAFSGGVTVNTGQTQTEYQKARGKGLAERMQSIQTDAVAAQSALTSLNVMDQAMSDPGFYSGAGGENALLLKRVGKTLGFDADGIDSMETFNAQSKAAALDVMGGSLGTGFSNADRDFVIDQVPNLSNTPEGNRALIEAQRRLQQRKIDIAQMARRYEAENNTLLGFDQELAQWAEQNPVFDPGFLHGLSAASEAAPTVRTYNPQTGTFDD